MQALHLLAVELRSLLEGRQARLQRTSSTQERPMPAITRWSRSHRVQVAGFVYPSRELLQRRRRPGLGPERGDHLVAVELGARGMSFAQARCLVPTRAGEAPGRRPPGSAPGRCDREARRARRTPGGGPPTSDGPTGRAAPRSRRRRRPGRLSGSKSTTGIFPIRRTRRSAGPRGRSAAGPRSSAPPSPAPRPLHLHLRQGSAQAARGDLDLGELRHQPKRGHRARRDPGPPAGELGGQFIRLVRGCAAGSPSRRTWG